MAEEMNDAAIPEVENVQREEQGDAEDLQMNHNAHDAENMRRFREMMIGAMGHNNPPWQPSIEECGLLLQNLADLKQREEAQNKKLPRLIDGHVKYFLETVSLCISAAKSLVASSSGPPSEIEVVTARLRRFDSISSPSNQDLFLLLQNLVSLKEQQEMLGNEFPEQIRVLISQFESMRKVFCEALVDFMRRSKWDDEEMELTTTIIETCPSIMKVKGNIIHPLPIHSAAGANASEFVVLLAKAGKRYGMREDGGLLSQDGIGMNVYQLLVSKDHSETLKALYDARILNRDVARRHSIAHFAAWCRSLKTLKLCADIDPASLFLEDNGRGSPLNVLACMPGDLEGKITTIKYIFNKAIQCDPAHPSVGGLLTPTPSVVRNEETVTTLHNMIERNGEDTTWNLIEEMLSRYTDIPILHRVIKHAPDQILNTIQRFPQAVFIRDNDNRLPIHVALEEGMQWCFELVSILNANISHLKDKDPVTGFYPYALAASEPSCDLKTIIHLLKLYPQHPQSSIVGLC